ncbi:MAG TPA: FG-GAP-like repeat-containing protein [Acidisarcina sp.]
MQQPIRSSFSIRSAVSGLRIGLVFVAIVSPGMTMVAAPVDAQGPALKTRLQAARLNNLGVALMNQQLQDKAAEKFDAAFHTDPTLTTAEINKGVALLYLGKLPESEKALEHAAALAPNDPHAWYALGLLRRSEARTEEGIKDFQRVLELRPDDADAHYFLGSFYAQSGDYDKAVHEFEVVLRLNRLHPSAEFALGSALRRQGKPDAAREHLAVFSHLVNDKIASAMKNDYGEQGPLSFAQDVHLAEPVVAPMIPIKMVATPIAAGAAALRSTAAQDPGAGRVTGVAGGGACLIDIEGKGREDLISMSGAADNAIRLFHNAGSGNYELVPAEKSGLTIGGRGIACAVGDFDNDGLPDLAVATTTGIALFRNSGGGKFVNVTETAKITNKNQPYGLTFVDFDHDGDLDLLVTGHASEGSPSASAASVLWRNNGNSTFTEWTTPTGLGGSGQTASAILSDLNNDRAVDLVITGSSEAPIFYANQREGPFKATPLYDDATLPASLGVTVLDYNKDSWMDVAVTHAGAPGITLWRNVEGKRFERVPLPITDALWGAGVTPIDIDNDGWIDLAVSIVTANGPEIRVLRNRGPDGFEDVSKSLGLDKIKLQFPGSLIAADMDGKGAADLIVTQADHDPMLLHNQGGEKNHSLRIAFTGVADNKSAIGTKVEVFANGLWQKFEVASSSGLLSQGSNEILAGLGANDHADIVRMLWPTGVPQDETDVAAVKAITFKESDRRGSSCPVLFAWDGTRYQFVTDVIGAAVVGHWISPSAKNTPDPDEWIKIEGSQLKERNGYFSLRFGEPMEEVNYVDHLRLVAVDHPEGTQVYPNERFLSERPFAEEKTIVSAAAHPPITAWDDKGRDALPTLRERDHKYVRDFTNLPFAGFADMHSLTLDLGEWSAANPLRLLMSGFIEYFSASSMYSAWQAGIEPVPPYVEAQLADGSWKRVIDDMGFPAGLPRTIVVDLTGKLPPGTRRIRLTSNLQIYWDQVLVDNGPEVAGLVRQTELPLSMAKLAFRGYPKQIDGETPGDLTYRYDQISATGPFVPQRGSYTHYGDVTPLLQQVSDNFVIFGSGEEVAAEFSAAPLPALPAHWSRDYFFYANGFVKDMDFYEALPFTVAEMPFHGMSGYPYPAGEHFPEDDSAVAYRLNWDDRFDAGSRKNDYRFHYSFQPSEPETVLAPALQPAGRDGR